ncbi:hypothetical protein PILCRDRAFT_713388 [Piloderma croceum F 1598]|uniref:F-box domain-containing protein n=1 Tax=Piloderma croceum (strain F 1598) TaxID=765440 RepID=A0A0C3F241_PILCF|nr:hypothetical protein PILCRDRAFT_713388 [Piloderma croceum F 1598]
MKRLSSGLESHADTDPFTRLPHKFPSLKTIKLTYSDEVPTPYDFPLFSSDYVYKQLYTLEAILREAHITKLTSLTIINFVALPPDFQRSESFANSLAKLAHLEVVFYAEIPGSTPIAEWSYDALFPKECMQRRYCGSHPEAPWAITHLTLGSQDEQGNLVPLDYSTLKFPYLSSLTLRGLSFRDLPDKQEAFILRHADTLRSLTLVDCLTLRLERFPIWERLAIPFIQCMVLMTARGYRAWRMICWKIRKRWRRTNGRSRDFYKLLTIGGRASLLEL